MVRESSHELRLSRAGEHLEDLEKEVARWRVDVPYRIILDTEKYGRETAVILEVLEEPPARLGLIASDFLHGVRAALDNLVFELVVAYHDGRPFPGRVEERSMFPIFRERDTFLTRREDYIGGIHPAAQAIIEGLQPYQKGRVYWSDSLWILHELARRDRHRLPYLAVTVPTGESFSVAEPLIPESGLHVFAPTADGVTEIGRYPTSTGFEPNTDVDLRLMLDVALRDAAPVPPLQPISETFRRIYRHIEQNVFPPLRAILFRS